MILDYGSAQSRDGNRSVISIAINALRDRTPVDPSGPRIFSEVDSSFSEPHNNISSKLYDVGQTVCAKTIDFFACKFIRLGFFISAPAQDNIIKHFRNLRVGKPRARHARNLGDIFSAVRIAHQRTDKSWKRRHACFNCSRSVCVMAARTAKQIHRLWRHC